jgi:iron complex outermembrane receptor protein
LAVGWCREQVTVVYSAGLLAQEKQMRRWFVLFFVSALLHVPDAPHLHQRKAYAAEPMQLPPVVVKESAFPPVATPDREYNENQAREAIERTPGAVALIGTEEIKESLGTNLKDVLDFVPGVHIQGRQGATTEESQLSIRGSGLRNNFHMRGVNILVDGFTLNNADGFFRPEVLELFSSKRVEIYKGGNALRFGGNSLGGAINLVSKTGADAGKAELWSEGGSFRFAKNYIASGRVYGAFDIYAGFSDTRSDGYRDHSETNRQRFFTSAGYRFSGGTTISFDLGYVRNMQALPGSLTRAEFKQNRRQRNTTPFTFRADERHDYDYVRNGLTLRTPLSPTQALEWSANYNYTDLEHPLNFAVISQKDNNWGTELRYLLTAPLFDHANRFTVGFQYAGTRELDLNFNNAGSGRHGAKTKDQFNRATNVGVYFEEQFDATSTVTLVVGGRLQYARRSVDDEFLSDGDSSEAVNFFSFTPKLGFIWKVMPEVQIYGNASRSYEPPLLLELTAPGQIGGDLSQLKAQKAWQFELGTRGKFGERAEWDFSVFDIELRDEIQNINVQPFPGAPFTIPRYQNIDRSRHYGTELGFNVVLAKGMAHTDDALRFHTAYTFSRFVFVNDPTYGGNDIPAAPRHYIQSELRYDHPSGFWIAPGLESAPKSYFVNSENTTRAPGYTLSNIRAGYNYRPLNLEVLFEARNLAGKEYVAAVFVDSADGRYYQPGDGRSFYGGVRWRW